MGDKLRDQWDALTNSPDSLAAMREAVLGGQGFAIIANRSNKLDAMTVDQLRSVHDGEAEDWRILGGAERAARPVPVRFLMPGRNDPISDLFVASLKLRSKVTTKHRKDSAEVITAVASDPGGIGVVNFASLPADLSKSSIKVIGIVDGKQTHTPTAESIMDGSYPYAERFYLYVHPKATKEAKDFATILAEPGRWANTFAEHGFVRTMPKPESESGPATKPTGKKTSKQPK